MALAALATRTFRAAYLDMMDRAALEEYIERTLTVAAVADDLRAAGNTYLLVELVPTGRLAGYAKLTSGGQPPAGVAPPATELERIYVEPDAIGQGIGAALMDRALQIAETAGFASIWLGVWERNERALTFYRRYGFEQIGSQPFRIGAETQRDLVLARGLGSAFGVDGSPPVSPG